MTKRTIVIRIRKTTHDKIKQDQMKRGYRSLDYTINQYRKAAIVLRRKRPKKNPEWYYL